MENNFKLVILTHNFDFYRNLSSRLSVLRENRFHAIKYSDKIELEQEKYQKNPFTNWKTFSDPKHEIASIPFVRNIAEFSGHDDIFNRLTSVLHQKQNTSTIKMQDLSNWFGIILQLPSSVNFSPTLSVEQQIYNLSNSICNSGEEKMELEDKVILSMGIRLKIEKYLIDRINDEAFVRGISKNQTYELSKKYKNLFPSEDDVLEILNRVNLITPENIHINSFMYEPILDMSNLHLKKLYEDVDSLN